MVKNKQADLFEATAPKGVQKLSEQQRVDWLRLIRSPTIGPITFRDLLNQFGGASAAIKALEGRNNSSRRFQLCSQEKAMREIEIADKFGAHIVALGEAEYPRWLQAIDAAPPLIYMKGRLDLAQRPSVGIVGSRNASGAGLKFASVLAQNLGDRGIVITSGLARGIDAAAHRAALATGTIAVLGGGLDHVYPAQNEEIYLQIATDGLLISERPLGVIAKAKDFPRRNRIISGISHGTIVVEAAMRSGSLITARFASEQGREVFAVPGHPLDPRATGTNKLIQNGANLITSSDDVLNILSPQLSDQDFTNQSIYQSSGFQELLEGSLPSGKEGRQTIHQFETSDEDLKSRVLELLGPTPIERDTLIRLLKCSAKDLQIILLDLDLEGLIEHHGQQRLSLSS